jgi:hypothetical protein
LGTLFGKSGSPIIYKYLNRTIPLNPYSKDFFMPYAELTVDQGTTYENNLDLVADDGTAINVAGYVFSGQIRKSYYSTKPTANFAIQIINAATGNVNIALSAATTANIKAGRYVYDVKMVDNFSQVTRIVEGIITITPQVTK